MKIRQIEMNGCFFKSGSFDLYDCAVNIYRDWDYGHAIAYLLRRFGPSINGGDGYKSFTEYVFNTPLKHVYLWVDPKQSLLGSFGYGVAPKLRMRLREEHVACVKLSREKKYNYEQFKKIPRPLADRYKWALSKSMRELLRPVFVRDSAFNILGPVQDSDIKSVAEYFEYAGYGVVSEYWDRFKEVER